MTDDEPITCPVCRSDLQPAVLASKSTDEVSWCKMEMRCSECGFRGFEWDELT